MTSGIAEDDRGRFLVYPMAVLYFIAVVIGHAVVSATAPDLPGTATVGLVAFVGVVLLGVADGVAQAVRARWSP